MLIKLYAPYSAVRIFRPIELWSTPDRSTAKAMLVAGGNSYGGRFKRWGHAQYRICLNKSEHLATLIIAKFILMAGIIVWRFFLIFEGVMPKLKFDLFCQRNPWSGTWNINYFLTMARYMGKCTVTDQRRLPHHGGCRSASAVHNQI